MIAWPPAELHPIMDLDQRRDTLWRKLALVINVLAGFALGLVGAKIAEAHDSNKAVWFATGIIALFFGVYVSILIHEVGHVLAGRRAGMSFRQMHVGPLGLSRSSGKTELFLNRRRNFGGFAYMMLPEGGDSAAILLRFVRGGPLSSLAFSLLLAIAAFVCWSTGLNVSALVLAAMFLGSIATLTGTVIPYSSRGMSTDALIIKRLSQPGPHRDFVVANFLLSKQMSAGVRARDWTESAIKTVLAASSSPSDRFRARYIAYTYYADRGDAEHERFYFELAEAIVNSDEASLGLMAESFWLQKAFLFANNQSDFVSARRLMSKAHSKAEVLEYSRLIAEAAIDVGEGNREKAAISLKRAKEALARMSRRTGCSIEEGTELILRLSTRAGLDTLPG